MFSLLILDVLHISPFCSLLGLFSVFSLLRFFSSFIFVFVGIIIFSLSEIYVEYIILFPSSVPSLISSLNIFEIFLSIFPYLFSISSFSTISTLFSIILFSITLLFFPSMFVSTISFFSLHHFLLLFLFLQRYFYY